MTPNTNNPFRPSRTFAPTTTNFDVREYGKIGQEFERGDARYIMSRSDLMTFADNPWKWKHGAKKEATDAMDWGSLVDCMVLTPQFTQHHFAISPSTYPAEGKTKSAPTEQKPWNLNANFCKDWVAERKKEGKTPVKNDTMLAAKKAVERVWQDERIAELLNCSERQMLVMVEYFDKETGITILVKTLPDIVPYVKNVTYGRYQGDFKTTADARPDKWVRRLWDEDYHVQGGMHMDAVNAATGSDRSGFYHAIQEQEAPYATARRMLSEEFLDMGRRRYRTQLARYCKALKTGFWPGYDDDDDRPDKPLYDGWRLSQPLPWMIE